MEQYLDIVFRCVCIYLFITTVLHIFGKKELSQLNTPDIILILLISNSVQNAMVGNNTTLLGGVAAATVLFSINFCVKKFFYKYPSFVKLINEKPIILIHDGILDENYLKKLNISINELEEAVREHGVEKIENVKLAMFEIDGNISIISGNNNELKQTQHNRNSKKIKKNKFTISKK